MQGQRSERIRTGWENLSMIRERHILRRRDFISGLGVVALNGLFAPTLLYQKTKGTGTLLIYHNVYMKHDTGPFHNEHPDRLRAIHEGLVKNRLLSNLQSIEPRAAAQEWIEHVHSKEYMDIVLHDSESGKPFLSTKSGNTALCRDSYEVALWAVGGLLSACDAVVSGTAQNAFCAIRPPGHHASKDRGMGYCLFNNVAVAARYLQKKHKLGKILIVDWDVHHGNGTQDIFYEDGSVFFFSTHQWPWYPWTGASEEIGSGKGRGATLNVPFPAGSGDKQLVAAYEEKLYPAATAFKPEAVLISAGFDSRSGDPLGRFRVTDEGFRKLTRILLEIARNHAGGRIISALEGGYNLTGLSHAVPAHVETLGTDKP